MYKHLTLAACAALTALVAAGPALAQRPTDAPRPTATAPASDPTAAPAQTARPAQGAGQNGSASSQLDGNTNTTIGQNFEAESGPATVGSQLVGVVTTPRPGGRSGDGGQSQPGTTTTESGGGTSDGDGPFEFTQGTQPQGDVVNVQSSRDAGDWAGSAAVALVTLAGLAFGIRKLPSPGR